MLSRAPEDWADQEGWEDYWRKILAKDEEAINRHLWRDINYFVHGERFKSQNIKRILFLGCGISQAPKFFAFGGFQVTALDISETAINFATNYEFKYENFYRWFNSKILKVNKQVWIEYCSRSHDANYERGSILDPAVARETFDLVIATRTLQCFCREESTIQKVLESINDRLAPNGKLLIFTINSPTAQEMINRQLEAMEYENALGSAPHLFDDKPGKAFFHMCASG